MLYFAFVDHWFSIGVKKNLKQEVCLKSDILESLTRELFGRFDHRASNAKATPTATTVPGRGDESSRKDGRTASYAGQFGPNYAEKRRRTGPGGRFFRSDNAPQDGDSAGAAGTAHSRRHVENISEIFLIIFRIFRSSLIFSISTRNIVEKLNTVDSA